MPIQVSIDEQIAEINRELAMRRKVYPDLIRFGKLKRNDANLYWARLKAVKRTLEKVQAQEQGVQTKLPIT